jgi:uncharacterized protein
VPLTYSFPGVYVEEIPSGVRTITGVSTSVTAFAGSARRGPINRAVHLLSYSDFERSFGGLSADSDMSYAVRQFFLNGGSDAWVIRLALNPVAASFTLQTAAAADVLEVTARDEGLAGNDIELRVDYNAGNPASNFNLTVSYAPVDSPSDARREVFNDLSMNSQNARYVETVVNAASQLVTVKRVASPALLGALSAGVSLSGELTQGGNLVDVATLVDPSHNQFQVSVNGTTPVAVTIAPGDITGANPTDRLTALCSAIQTKVQAGQGTNPQLAGFTCAVQDGNRIKMTSSATTEFSSVQVLPGSRNDVAARLKLGALNGGTETDAAAGLRPAEKPDRGSLTSGVFGNNDLNTLPSNAKNSLVISLDGDSPSAVSLGTTAAAGADLAAKLADVAARLTAAVRALKPSRPAYSGFTARANDAGDRLILESGTRGAGSSVVVNAADAASIADELHLLAGATSTQPQNLMLRNGNEQPYNDQQALGVFIADRSTRKGIYALEAVDLFNILCLPGVTDPAILADTAAYCEERRAFLIVDAPETVTTPDQMVTLAQGVSLPKSRNAAAYFPWICVADPLAGGQLRPMPPSGAIAGLYARTDSTRGVWKAPAGTEATVVGALGVAYTMTDLQNGTLNPLGINAIRVFPVYGTVAWGARTLRGADQMADEYKYIPVRRLALFIEESLYRGTQWVVFEPNDEPLWSQIRLNVGAFMNNLFRQGAFQGKTPREAYFVKCDKETTTQNDINLGIVNILVGFAPLKPAEFVVIQLQQMAGQIQA